MKKFFLLMLFLCSAINAHGADLMEVFQQALRCDPIYQAAIAQRLADIQSIPISHSALLPSIVINGTPSTLNQTFSGPAAGGATGVGKRGYDVNLTVTQTIFNYAQFVAVCAAKSTAKQADAVFNAATQDLMIRVSRAYFAILQDEDNLRYLNSSKEAYEKQLDQVKQQYRVGLRTTTDVYTAQASYDNAAANVITAEVTLKDDRENLRVITGVYYTDLAKLSEDFPLVTPCPDNIEIWSRAAAHQNWSVVAAQYAADVARQNIKQQFAGNLPIVNLQGIYDQNYYAYSGESLISLPGGLKTKSKTLTLNVEFPVFQGGYVVATTRQAQFQFQVFCQRLEKALRDAVNLARQSYYGVIAGISQIKADKLTVQSTKLSYEGLNESYHVGTETLVNVLDQQQKVFLAERKYAADRYEYVNNLLSLKQSAGSLSPNDLLAINSWLINSRSYSFKGHNDISLPPPCPCANKVVIKQIAKVHLKKRRKILV